jgi:uncharacterized membrane protein
MEKVGIIIIATAAIVSLGVNAMLKTITGSERQGLNTLKLRLAKGELTESQYRQLRAILQEKHQG